MKTREEIIQAAYADSATPEHDPAMRDVLGQRLTASKADAMLEVLLDIRELLAAQYDLTRGAVVAFSIATPAISSEDHNDLMARTRAETDGLYEPAGDDPDYPGSNPT